MTNPQFGFQEFYRSAGGVVALVLLCSCSLLSSGCRSDKSGTGSMASVVVHNVDPGAVRGATIDVFESDGYKLARRDKESMVFEKKASSMTNLAYGNWMESQVWSRVTVFVEPMSESVVRVRCSGYAVRDKGGATEEQLKTYRRGPYQKLMDEVARRLSPKQ